MSNSKSAIKEIKSLMVQFGFLKNDEIELLSFKTEDDTILNTEKLAVGSKIYKINEAFEQVSLEDGSYKLKENFDIEVKAGEIVAVKEIFVDAKLVDGTVLKIAGEAIAEGAKVVVVTADAEVPAPDGTHELEGGDKIETKDGVIVKYEEVGVEPAEGMPEAEAPEVPAIDAPMGMEAELMSMLKEFISKVSEKMSHMEESYSSLQNEFNAFKKLPAAKKIADGKTDFNKEVEDVLEARLKTLNSLKNK
jgi:dihydroxyacetone kinase DhaKLM complex PTS-EIIA-like component DhaM